MTYLKFAPILLFLGITGCPAQPEPHVPAPNPPPDTDLVGAMCERLLELGCEEGQDVYNDNIEGPVDVPNQSCEDFHTELQDQGVFVNPRCVLMTPDCESIEDYRAKKPEDCKTE